MNQALFREQAVRRQQDRLAGSVILSQPLRARLLCLGLCLFTLLALVFLGLNSYARKVSVSGRLVPSAGLISITAPQAGQVSAIFAEAGEPVAAGQALFELQLDHTLQASVSLSEELLDKLRAQEQALQTQLRFQDDLVSNITGGLAQKEKLLRQTRLQLGTMLEHGRQLLQVKQAAVRRAQQLHERQLLSQADLEAVQAQALQQQQACDDLQLRIIQTSASIQDLITQRNSSLLQNFQQSQQLQSQLAEVRLQQLRLSAEQVTTVYAPVAGRVSSQQLKTGMTLQAQQPVLSLLPADSQLQAELAIPSRAVGFVQADQPVTIRFDAFPYQKFGTQQATIIRVPDSAEQSQWQQDGQVSLYRALAALDKQTVTAFGSEQALRAGMEFSADVVLEQRSLLEWLLEPLYSIRGHR